jgi:peptidyl-tRNA hydrolase, PTH1 family
MVHKLFGRLKRERIPAGHGAEWILIVGLGNPGAEYAAHRHNIGFRCVDHLAQHHGLTLNKRRFKAVFGEGRVDGARVILAKPQTFMNDSGSAVAPLSRWYKIAPAQILVIYDDLDLPFGRIRVRPGGGSGGHNGIKSIIASLGTQEFPRIRVGIGRPRHGDPVDYVLNAFDREQEPFVPDLCDRVALAVQTFIAEGVREAMNVHNGPDQFSLGEK